MGEHVGGRPVLVGTASVENSEKLSELLTRRYGIEHEVLNAKNHAREAEIVAKAGQQREVVRGKKKEIHGNVTIATNMAGRGTDIVLGPGVAAIGGLHVVGTERHEAGASTTSSAAAAVARATPAHHASSWHSRTSCCGCSWASGCSRCLPCSALKRHGDR